LVLDRHPLRQLRHDGRGGDRGTATERLELEVGDVVGVVDLDRDLHHITADRVAHFSDTVGVIDHTYVARIVEVIHDLVGVEHGDRPFGFLGYCGRYASAPNIRA
jgi:hypothetical protein